MGGITGKWNPRILFLGSVMVDVLSFYPQVKQYLLPHDPPTNWLLLGWGMMLAGAIVNIVFVEGFFPKLWMSRTKYWTTFKKNKNLSSIFEESALSLENSILMIGTIFVMTR
ncbi:hypothetical protein HZC00_05405 [Candidatus Kaiserbacteria bacterium]|nr:hypothetical protein [Candidatus Kaiserbacteria bacterium]